MCRRKYVMLGCTIRIEWIQNVLQSSADAVSCAKIIYWSLKKVVNRQTIAFQSYCWAAATSPLADPRLFKNSSANLQTDYLLWKYKLRSISSRSCFWQMLQIIRHQHRQHNSIWLRANALSICKSRRTVSPSTFSIYTPTRCTIGETRGELYT